MKRRVARWFLVVVTGVGFLTGGIAGSFAQTNSAPKASSVSAQEREGCMNNLKVIYDAIQAYKNDHKDLPNWLSDLVPQYLGDANVLICPSCLRTGHLEQLELSDPKIASSYLFEFCPVPLGKAAPNAPNRSRREWKERQLALVGPVVPIVRCRHHKQVINLGYDGKIYESPGMWETLLTNKMDIATLTPPKMFANEPAAVPGTNAVAKSADNTGQPNAQRTQKSAQKAGKGNNGLINLSKFCNAATTNSWFGGAEGDDLASLPMGRQKFGGVEFDVRGILQLGGKSLAETNFPAVVRSIRVRRQCEKIYFLHGAVMGSAADEKKKIGAFVIHYSTNETAMGQMRVDLPIVYGKNVRDWHVLPDEPEAGKELKVAWTGENEAGKQSGRGVRLFMTEWTNAAPGVEIDHIDFNSSMAGAAPFLVGITVE